MPTHSPVAEGEELAESVIDDTETNRTSPHISTRDPATGSTPGEGAPKSAGSGYSSDMPVLKSKLLRFSDSPQGGVTSSTPGRTPSAGGKKAGEVMESAATTRVVEAETPSDTGNIKRLSFFM